MLTNTKSHEKTNDVIPVDAYPLYAASALAANSFVRCAFSGEIPPILIVFRLRTKLSCWRQCVQPLSHCLEYICITLFHTFSYPFHIPQPRNPTCMHDDYGDNDDYGDSDDDYDDNGNGHFVYTTTATLNTWQRRLHYVVVVRRHTCIIESGSGTSEKTPTPHWAAHTNEITRLNTNILSYLIFHTSLDHPLI